MPNLLIPPAERDLTPYQIEMLDRRRSWGLTLQSIAGLLVVIGVILWLWVGQDLTYSPGMMHPMFYYDALLLIGAAVLASIGTAMRIGRPEF